MTAQPMARDSLSMANNSLPAEVQRGLHVALIMDGNGRWARAQGLPRSAGHRKGVEAARNIVEAAAGMGIATLTLYTFSADNWQRPAKEVDYLMGLLMRFLREEQRSCRERNIRLRFIGRRDRFSAQLLGALEAAEAATATCSGLDLRLAVDYSGRESIFRALRSAEAQGLTDWREFAATADLAPEVDLLIRTGGEKRLSDFLLWELAYAELIFVDTMWPDFTPLALREAMQGFARRERRFGAIPMGEGQKEAVARNHQAGLRQLARGI